MPADRYKGGARAPSGKRRKPLAKVPRRRRIESVKPESTAEGGTKVYKTTAKSVARTFGAASKPLAQKVDPKSGLAKRTRARARSLGIELGDSPITRAQARRIRAKKYMKKSGLSG